MAKEAITKALADAKINYSEVKQAVVGYVYGSSRLCKFQQMSSTEIFFSFR